MRFAQTAGLTIPPFESIHRSEYRLPETATSVISLNLISVPQQTGRSSSQVFVFFADGKIMILDMDIRSMVFQGSLGALLREDQLPRDADRRLEVEWVHSRRKVTIADHGSSQVSPDHRGHLQDKTIFEIVGCAAGKRQSKVRRMMYTLHFINDPGSQTLLHVACVKVVQLPVPTTSEIHFLEPSYYLDAKRDQLIRKTGRTISVIGLKGPIGQVVSEMQMDAPLVRAWLPVSSTISLATSAGQITAYSSRHGSRLAACADSLALSLITKKRKDHSGPLAPETSLDFVDAGLRIVVGHCSGQLLAVPFSFPGLQSNREADQDLLIDSIGRGAYHRQNQLHRLGKAASERLSLSILVSENCISAPSVGGTQLAAIADMRSASEANRNEDFDDAFFGMWQNTKKPLVNASDATLLLQYPKQNHQEQCMISVLAMIFSLQSTVYLDHETQTDSMGLVLKLRCFPRRTLRWMFASGTLSVRNLTLALRSNASELSSNLSHESVCQHLLHAIEAADTSLSLLVQLLESPIQLYLRSIIDSAAYLTGLLQQDSTLSAEAGTTTEGGIITSRAFDSSYLPSPPLTTPSGESPTPSEDSSVMIHRRRTILQLYLKRVLDHPRTAVIDIIRARFGSPRLLQLMDMLNEAVQDWDRQLDSGLASVHVTLTKHELFRLIELVLDSLGAQGFQSLTLGRSPQSLTELSIIVSDLRTSSSLQIEEAIAYSDLISSISGLETYESNAKSSMPSDSKPRNSLAALDTDHDPALTAPWGSIVRYGAGEESEHELPMGLKDKHWLSSVTVNAGGEFGRRSKREFARKRAENLPDWTLERICI